MSAGEATGTRREQSGDDRPWSPWRILLFIVGRVIVDPVREGRLRDNGWQRGLRPIVGVGIVLYVVVMVTAVVSGQIRSNAQLVFRPPQETFPLIVFPLIMIGVIFVLSCLFTAGLHLAWWLRPVVALVVLSVIVRPLDLARPDWSNWVYLGCAALLILLMIIRWRRSFVWWEFLVTLILIGHAVVANVITQASTYEGYATDLRLNALMLLIQPLIALAAPAAMLAGAAMAELTATTVAWTVTGVWQGLNRLRRRALPWGVAVLILLAVWRVAWVGWHVVQGEDGYQVRSLLLGALSLVPPMLLCGAVAWRADRVAGGDRPRRPDSDDVTTDWSRYSLIMALLLSLGTMGTTLISSVLGSFGLGEVGRFISDLGGTYQSRFAALVIAVVVLLMAFVLSGRGLRIAPMSLAAFGGIIVSATVNTQWGIDASVSGSMTGAAALAVVILIMLGVRGRMTAERGMALATVLLLSGAYEFREYIFEPMTALFAITGVGAALIVGLVWRLLTDNGYSRGDSAKFPRSSRVLLAVANATFAATVVALASLMGGHWDIGLLLGEDVGDSMIGLSLVVAVMFAGLSLAARGRTVRSRHGPTREEVAATQGVQPDAQPAEGNRLPDPAGDENWHERQ